MAAAKWEAGILGNFVRHQKGFAFKSSEYRPHGHPVVRVSNFTDRTINMADCNYIDSENISQYLNYALHTGDVVIATVGSWPSNEASVVGRTIRVPPEADGAFLNQNAVRLRGTAELNEEFLFYLLKTENFQTYLVGTAQGSANQASITLRDIFGYEFPLPPLSEQRAIARILGTLDDKIALNRRINETLEAMARALFKSWFVDFDPVRAKVEGRDPGLPKPIADLFPDSFEESELGDIPKGWRVGTLGMLGKLAIGGDWGEGEAFAGAIDANCLRGVDLEHLRQSGHASAPRRWFKPSSLERRAMDDRDVLIAGSGAGPTGRPLWMCADLLQVLGPCVYSNFCKRIRCGTAAEAVYLDAWLHGMRESGEIWEHVNGTSVPNLDANSLLAGKEIPLPPVPVLDRYYGFVRPIRQELYAGQNGTLAALRDTLLPKLISGELRVKDASRFPAEEA
ncbi:MAG: restriction endonuclease subunit S [Acidobacteriota bacterium]